MVVPKLLAFRISIVRIAFLCSWIEIIDIKHTAESTTGFPLSRKCRRRAIMIKGRFMFTAHCFRRTTRDCFYANTSKCHTPTPWYRTAQKLRGLES
ncbi:hypothetical protein ANTRET_LOCUS4051 [Anthophora retusa]